MRELLELVELARVRGPGPNWVTDGGRTCPLGWMDCSQPVFRIAGTDVYDYGEPGGPGAKHCATECPHRGQLPDPEPDDPEFKGLTANHTDDARTQ